MINHTVHMKHNLSYQYHILSCRITSCHSYAISYTFGMYRIAILGTVISGSCSPLCMCNRYHIHQHIIKHIYIQTHLNTYTYMTRCYSQFTSCVNSPRLPFRFITCLCMSYIVPHKSIYHFF